MDYEPAISLSTSFRGRAYLIRDKSIITSAKEFRVSRSRQRVGTESLRGNAVDHQFEKNPVIGQIDDVSFVEDTGLNSLGQIARVFRSEPEGNHGAHVAENRRPDFAVQLLDVLMSQGQAQSIFPGFRQDIGK